jgi:HEAT repeat protein
MGLFDLFTKRGSGEAEAKSQKGTSPRELARLTRVVSNKMSQNYDRQDAIEALSQMGNADGARALLKRFDFSMEPSIVDQDEKEAAARGIVAAGKASIQPIRDYCARAESLSWPLKVLRQVVPSEELVAELLTLLEQFDTEYLRNPEPKIQLVSLLEEYPCSEVRDAVTPFLGDVNESVRFHAAGTLFKMADESTLIPLVDTLAEEESLRVKNRIARGLQAGGWQLPPAVAEKAASALPTGFEIKDRKVVLGG